MIRMALCGPNKGVLGKVLTDGARWRVVYIDSLYQVHMELSCAALRGPTWAGTKGDLFVWVGPTSRLTTHVIILTH